MGHLVLPTHKPNFACLRFWFSFWSGSQLLGTWQVSTQPGIRTWVKSCSNPLFGPITKKADALDPVVWFFWQIFATWRQEKKGWQIQRRAFLKLKK
jgi:hypothetical protein